MPRKRGAVVIGVDRTGDLPLLEASARGAIKFSDWLRNEGFKVIAITDRKLPVTAARIMRAIRRFVLSGTYDQLVVYFTGHGYWKNDAELWLLSGAPANANEAVNWKETVEFAKDCGIPSVVLISDACRSIPETPRAQRVRGSIVFPNDDIRRDRAKVDKFVAAAIGTAAYEIPIDGRKENAFTHCLLRAYEAPDADMVVRVQEDGRDIEIVPNRKLGPYLRREVSALLAGINITLDQTPDDEVTSDESVYIGRAKGAARPAASPGADFVLAGKRRRKAGGAGRPNVGPVTTPTIREIASKVFHDALNLLPTELEAREIRPVVQTGSGEFDQALSTAGSIAERPDELSTTGFAVLGTRIADCIIAGGRTHHIVTHGDGTVTPGLIKLHPQLQSGTAVVRFENGNGVALAALKGYIGHVIVDEGNVVSINYVPSARNSRHDQFARRRAQLQRLRAAAAAAIRFGVFRLDDADAARRLADRIRIQKAIDPTLGLYAAYAYSEAGAISELCEVKTLMELDLGVSLFDVAMLDSRRLPSVRIGAAVPFCPLLTQGWNFLRMCKIKLPKVLDEAQDELARAVWTTFLPERTEIIFNAIRNGELS